MMKKFAAFLLCILFAICLFACSKQDASVEEAPIEEQITETTPTIPATIPVPSESEETDEFRFAQGTVICGADVSDMLAADAHAAICQALSEYTVNVQANGKSVNISGSKISLTCPEDAFAALVDAVTNETDYSTIQLVSYDSDALRHELFIAYNTSARNASISYDSSADTFRLNKDTSGKSLDIDTIKAKLEPVILALGTELSVTVNEKAVEASIKADSDQAKKALSKANAYLDIQLTYSYTPDNKPTQYETLSKDTIGSLIAFSNDLSSYVSSNALRSYVNQMSSKYSVKGDAGQFKTSGGYYISLTVDYAGQPVNTDGLYDDIRYCLENGISGTRTAPYLAVIECEEMAFDGNYVEVNLSAQYLWVYRNGNCVVSTPIVSGCAYYHNTTPTGVYSIYGKSTGVYLVGETWNSYVNYWMPFKGGYGLHDASWRSEFGGDIYLYDGSHGCVNLPSGVAGSVFNNVSVGTKVILYGGATSAEPVQQNIKGTEKYEVNITDAPFKLDTQPEYGEDKTLTYASDNTSVAEVAADGTVTIKAEGTAKITVTAAEREYYTSAQMTVTVQVVDLCKKNGHSFGAWEKLADVTCTADGKQSRSCSVCEAKEDSVIPATGHHFGSWSTVTNATCTTAGKQVRSCSGCTAKEESAIAATGHNFGPWSTVTNPTCTAAGKQARSCSRCTAKEESAIAATGHTFGPWNTVTPPTCTTAGKQVRSCSGCTATEESAIAVTDHTFGPWSTVTDATCTTEGDQIRTCSSCTQTEHRAIPAGHDMGEWTVTVAPGCESDGTNTRTCADCTHSETQTVPATGHNYTSSGEFCGNGCGTSNPNYTPPVTDSPPSDNGDTTPDPDTPTP